MNPSLSAGKSHCAAAERSRAFAIAAANLRKIQQALPAGLGPAPVRQAQAQARGVGFQLAEEAVACGEPAGDLREAAVDRGGRHAGLGEPAQVAGGQDVLEAEPGQAVGQAGGPQQAAADPGADLGQRGSDDAADLLRGVEAGEVLQLLLGTEQAQELRLLHQAEGVVLPFQPPEPGQVPGDLPFGGEKARRIAGHQDGGAGSGLAHGTAAGQQDTLDRLGPAHRKQAAAQGDFLAVQGGGFSHDSLFDQALEHGGPQQPRRGELREAYLAIQAGFNPAVPSPDRGPAGSGGDAPAARR